MLGQTQDPKPGQDQPTPPPADPPSEPGGAGTTTPPQGEPLENGGEENGNGDDEPPAPDEKAYAALSVGESLVVDQAALADFKKLAVEAKLPVATAQKLLDLHGQMQSAAQRGWQAQVQAWRQQAEADPYLSGDAIVAGGFGSFKDATAAAGRFLNQYGDTELRQALDAYGLGNHPALVRALAKAGRDLTPDTLHSGRATPRADTLRARYPSMSEDFFSH